MVREQEMLLGELAQFVNLVEGRSDLGLTEAKSWTMEVRGPGSHIPV